MSKTASNYTLHIEGREQQLPCERDKTILHSLIEGGVFLEANCGGRGTCGKCKIQVLQGKVIGKDGNEVEGNNDSIYQACQVYPESDVTILLKSTEASQKGQACEIALDNQTPLVKKIVVELAYPTVDNHFSLQEMI
jgi:ferredoxin